MDLSLLLLLKNIPPRVEINSIQVINSTRNFFKSQTHASYLPNHAMCNECPNSMKVEVG